MRTITTPILLHKVTSQYITFFTPKSVLNRNEIIILFFLLVCNNQNAEGEMGTLMDNVVLFCKTMLQKLHSGTFAGDPESLLDFLADQIMVVRHFHKVY